MKEISEVSKVGKENNNIVEVGFGGGFFEPCQDSTSAYGGAAEPIHT